MTLASLSHAQPLVTIDTVTVGDAGNAAATTGYGAVTNVFAIGKYEVTIGQYNTILNGAIRRKPPPAAQYGDTGFRLATDPEPSTYVLLALGAAGQGAHVLRRRRK